MFERIDLLIRLANKAKDHSEYALASRIFAYLAHAYFRVFADRKLIMLESIRPHPTHIPPILYQWVTKSYRVGKDQKSPYLDYDEFTGFDRDTKQAWGLLCRSGKANLATLVSPLSGERLCIPTPRLKDRARGMLYVVAQQVPRHTSARLVVARTPEVSEGLVRQLSIMTSAKLMERAVRVLLKDRKT